MKRLLNALCLLVVFVSGAAVPGSGYAPASAADAAIGLLPPQQGQDSTVKLVSSSRAEVTFVVEVPVDAVTVTPVTVGERIYSQVSVNGWLAGGEAGAPELPRNTVSIGIPFGANYTLTVIPGKAHTLPLHAPVIPVETTRMEALPVPAAAGKPSLPTLTQVIETGAESYPSQAEYPGMLAEVVSDGIMRQQRIAGVSVYPIQYRPAAGELVVYETLRVDVSFDEPASLDGQPAPVESEYYEVLLRADLLNYETARSWRQTEPEGSAAAPWMPPSPGWRVSVSETGMYRMTYAELEAAGLPVSSLAPDTLQMFTLGEEIAIEVNGEQDGSFDPGDWIAFYGQAIDSKYTADNIYWLTYGGANGLRTAVRSGAPGSGITPVSYRDTLELESNIIYNSVVPGDDDLERWLWSYAYPPSVPTWDLPILLAQPITGTASITVSMLGFIIDPITPDHHIQIYLNDAMLGETWWDGLTWQELTLDVPAGLLSAGINNLSVVDPNDTGVGYDVVYMDRVSLEYDSGFLVTGDEISFGFPEAGDWKFNLDGFTSDQVLIYDVSDPAAVVKMTDFDVLPSGGGYAAEFEDEVVEPRDYLALVEGMVGSVRAIEADTPSDLQDTSTGADYIIITHQDFVTETLALSEFRAAQGLRTLVADVQDVYDEFGYGIAGAGAIRSYLEYAYTAYLAPAPSFVVLVGDGHYDPKDYNGYGRTSFIPPYLANVDPWLIETAADNRYVTLAGDDTLPDMMLGRLAVSTPGEAAAFIAKIIAYEQDPAYYEWQQQVLLVADNPEGLFNFPSLLDVVDECCLPEPYTAEKMYYGVTITDTAEARLAILDGINSGKLIVNYAGHASQDQWADEPLFQATDVASLTNTDRLPVILAMTCMEGYYHYPYPDEFGLVSLAEMITRANQVGAVASWSASGFGIMSGHYYLDTGFYRSIFLDENQLMGQAATAGKLELWASGSNLDLVDTFLIFGDPATKVHALPLPEITWQAYLPMLMRVEEP